MDELVVCWFCGVEPIALIEITTLSDAAPRYLPNWPAGDHEHAAQPPTPGQLEQAGHDTLMAIRRAGS